MRLADDKLVSGRGSVPLGPVALGGKGLAPSFRGSVTDYAASKATLGKPTKSKTPYADMLGQIQEEQQKFYEEAYRPLGREMVADVNSTAIVDAAKAGTSSYSAERTAQRGARQRARLGITGTPSEQAMSEYQASLGATTTADGAINQARVQQKERNDALRTDLLNISRGIQTSAINSATNAATTEANRNATNANAAAQNKTARNAATGTLASLALMAVAFL